MVPPVSWALLVVGATIAVADPDFYSAWCPCRRLATCPNYYGRFFDDVLIFGQVPPCKKFDYVRCCSSDNIPEGFDLEQQVQYLPESVEPQRAVVQRALAQRDSITAAAAQEVRDFKAHQEKLKRDIANGIDNPNPPCGCYTAGTCPGRYSTKSTGRDIGCLPGYETCCFLDDPWPNYQVTDLTINAPCSVAKTCAIFFGTSPYDISSYGPLEPCYLGQNRCLDFLQEGSDPQPARVRPEQQQPTQRPTPRPTPQPTHRPTPRPTTQRPTYRPRPQPTFRPTPRPTTRPTYRPRPQPTFRPAPRPTTRPTYRPRTRPTYRPRPQPTFRPTPRPTYRPRTRPTFRPATPPTYAPTTRPTYAPPTTTPYRTTTRKLPEPQPDDSGSNNIFDIVGNGAYLPPSREFGDPAARAKNAGLAFALPF